MITVTQALSLKKIKPYTPTFSSRYPDVYSEDQIIIKIKKDKRRKKEHVHPHKTSPLTPALLRQSQGQTKTNNLLKLLG